MVVALEVPGKLRRSSGPRLLASTLVELSTLDPSGSTIVPPCRASLRHARWNLCCQMSPLVLRCFDDQLRPPALCECVEPPCELVASERADSSWLVQEHHWQQTISKLAILQQRHPRVSPSISPGMRIQTLREDVLKTSLALTSSNCSHDPGGTVSCERCERRGPSSPAAMLPTWGPSDWQRTSWWPQTTLPTKRRERRTRWLRSS